MLQKNPGRHTRFPWRWITALSICQKSRAAWTTKFESRIQIWKFQNFGMACGTKHGRTMHKHIKTMTETRKPSRELLNQASNSGNGIARPGLAKLRVFSTVTVRGMKHHDNDLRFLCNSKLWPCSCLSQRGDFSSHGMPRGPQGETEPLERLERRRSSEPVRRDGILATETLLDGTIRSNKLPPRWNPKVMFRGAKKNEGSKSVEKKNDPDRWTMPLSSSMTRQIFSCQRRERRKIAIGTLLVLVLTASSSKTSKSFTTFGWSKP